MNQGPQSVAGVLGGWFGTSIECGSCGYKVCVRVCVKCLLFLRLFFMCLLCDASFRGGLFLITCTHKLILTPPPLIHTHTHTKTSSLQTYLYASLHTQRPIAHSPFMSMTLSLSGRVENHMSLESCIAALTAPEWLRGVECTQ